MENIEEHFPNAITTYLCFFVNGKKVSEPSPQPEWTLLWYLRRRLQLSGTKYGCGEGGCGACTVMLSRYSLESDTVNHIAINACLTPVCSLHGTAITTVEGIGSTEAKLHPVQERIAKAHGSQCGFCTPGFVMSMYTLLRNKTNIVYEDIEIAFQGNLCRCTGYRPIIDGFKTFVDAWTNKDGHCLLGKDCCKYKNDREKPLLFQKSSFQPYDPAQEPIFPPELKLNLVEYNNAYLVYRGVYTTWLRPNTLKQLLKLKKCIPSSKIVAGNTEIGVEMKFKNMIYPVLISPSVIPDLTFFKVTEKGLTIGAGVTLTNLKEILEKEVSKSPVKGKIFQAIIEMLHWFAGSQVRNVASIAGNIITASPISDLNPVLMAASAKLYILRGNQDRNITVDDDFFVSYRQTTIRPDELLMSIDIPFSDDLHIFKAYKQARRKEDDISIVTAAFSVKFDENTMSVSESKLCFGGLGPTTKSASVTSNMMKGMKWETVLLDSVLNSLSQEFELYESVPGGMPEYRKTLCLSLFLKFFYHVSHKINNDIINRRSKETYLTSLLPKSSQYFDIKNDNRRLTDTVGMPIAHASAFKQATGEAIYCDDLPQVQGELFLALIISNKPYARIKQVDASKALSMPGVEAFFSASDIATGCNKLGPIIKDEEIFSSAMVTSRACIIGAIVAQDEMVARQAQKQVVVTYEELTPVIITLEDAIKFKSYFDGYPRTIQKGNVAIALNDSNIVIEGSARTGAQEHFYLETVCAFAIRKEDELEIICSSQHPAEIAQLVSHSLGIPNHKIVAKVKRIGGGFGGKETRTAVLAVPVAIAAYKLKKPIRAVLDRDEDMQITGYRHPILVNYKVGFSRNGVINAAVFDLYSNAGNSMDISCSLNERATTHLDNCYYIPNVIVNGYVCKTNLPSNTAFRGFGAPQAMFATENMIRDIAQALGKTYEEIVDLNMYREGHLTHYNQLLTYCTLTRCWNECIEISDYKQRKRAVEEFNKVHVSKKKGIALVPTKYGISFQTDILMQAGVLLLIYTDGSVLLSIGGIEMGQGLFTKMIQVASKALEVSVEKININEMATDKVPNSSPTAGSISSDLYGMAVLDACNKLVARLKPYKDKQPDGKWEDWVMNAYLDRVNLATTGFYSAPKIEYNFETNSGRIFEYYTYGVACSEVIIDCLTGDHQVLRTDIVMDVGESINPAIDIGQIEGAFMQGYGLFTLEEMLFSAQGEVLSRGPGTYKIPTLSDIPREFNVSLLKGAPNPRAVYSSKAVGEPPLFLAASVFFAISDAVAAARAASGKPAPARLAAPATCERVRMACEDRITDQVIGTIIKDGKPKWNVIV